MTCPSVNGTLSVPLFEESVPAVMTVVAECERGCTTITALLIRLEKLPDRLYLVGRKLENIRGENSARFSNESLRFSVPREAFVDRFYHVGTPSPRLRTWKQERIGSVNLAFRYQSHLGCKAVVITCPTQARVIARYVGS